MKNFSVKIVLAVLLGCMLGALRYIAGDADAVRLIPWFIGAGILGAIISEIMAKKFR